MQNRGVLDRFLKSVQKNISYALCDAYQHKFLKNQRPSWGCFFIIISTVLGHYGAFTQLTSSHHRLLHSIENIPEAFFHLNIR